MKKHGFTILEISIVAVFAGLLLILFLVQKSNIDAMERDEDRKIAINAMYYALEEGFYKEHHYYPETISEENIKVMKLLETVERSAYSGNSEALCEGQL